MKLKIASFQVLVCLLLMVSQEQLHLVQAADPGIEETEETDSPSMTTQSKRSFTCPNRNSTALFPDPDCCTIFYHCSNGVAYRFDCPAGLVFNSDAQDCDWPYNVEGCNDEN